MECVLPDTHVVHCIVMSDTNTFLTNISKQHRVVIISVAHFSVSFRVRLLQHYKEQQNFNDAPLQIAPLKST